MSIRSPAVMAAALREQASQLADDLLNRHEFAFEVAFLAALLIHLSQVPKGTTKEDCKASWMREAEQWCDRAMSKLKGPTIP